MKRIMTISLFMLFAAASYGQAIGLPAQGLFADAKMLQTDSGTILIQQLRKGCKNLNENSFVFSEVVVSLPPLVAAEEKTPAFVIHGNLTYNFNYRSYLDTPFAETNLMQHTLQTRLNIKYKDKYPFTVYLTGRTSNSPFFSNDFDVSVQFRQADMLEDIKRKMRSDADSILYNKALSLSPAQLYKYEQAGILKDPGSFVKTTAKNASNKYVGAKKEELEKRFKKLYDDYKEKADKLAALLEMLKQSAGKGAVEAREKKLRDQLKDSISVMAKNYFDKKKTKYSDAADSLKKQIAEGKEKIDAAKEKLQEGKEKLDKAKAELAEAEKKIKGFQKKITDSLQEAKKIIAAISDKKALFDYLRKKGEAAPAISGFQKTLLSVKQIGIGKTWIDYSDLTVKNISIAGFNIETNPGNIYLAAAAGKVNFRFKDYIIKGSYTGSGQSVGLIRAGFGKKDGNNVIFTYYTGNKSLLNQTPLNNSAVKRISGFSIESGYTVNKNNHLTAEYARSVSAGIPGKIWQLNTHNNEAFGIKLFSKYKTTDFNGYFRRTGEGFQSFTLFPTNTRQDAWLAKLTKSFWKKRISAELSVRKNDFNSPIALPGYSSKNIFKSFRIMERIPKYPFVMIGYYPSSQLVLSDDKTLYENRYNTLNMIVSHSYFFKKLSMSSNFSYIKFYNEGTDSSFIYYNAASYTFNHTVMLKSLVLEGSAVLTDQSQLYQLTLEPVITYKWKDRFSVSGGFKWSRVNHAETLWGGTAGLGLLLNKIGMIQMHYEKIYLPGYNRNLLPVDIGRLTFSREF